VDRLDDRAGRPRSRVDRPGHVAHPGTAAARQPAPERN
jgi:hypothetical protein